MKHIKLFEQWDRNQEQKKSVNKTTVGEFFNWYSGPNWFDGYSGTTDGMMVIDSEGGETHAQMDGEEGMTHVRDLKSAEMEDIVVTCEYIPDVFGFECKFTLPSNGKTYIVDAEDPFPERSFK